MDLRSYFDQMGIPYSWRHHDPAYTAQDLATKEHVAGRKVVKPVVVQADGQFILCALPAPCHIDLAKLREELQAREAKLAEETQLKPLFGDCELGAEPPIGRLFGIPTMMDESLMQQEELTFQAGTHEDAVTISIRDYMRLAEPRVGQFARQGAW